MELLYVWIKKYKNIEEQGFNFSPKWRFKYDPQTGELDVEDRRDKVIDNFFGEHISNVTAIVGENGSGKSSLLYEAGRNLTDGVTGKSSKNIVAFYHKDKVKIIGDKPLFVTGISNEDFLISNERSKLEYDISIFYYSHALDFKQMGQSRGTNKHFINISISSLIHQFQNLQRNDFKYKESVSSNFYKSFHGDGTFIDSYIRFDKLCQIIFYLEYDQIRNEFPFINSKFTIFGDPNTLKKIRSIQKELFDDFEKYFIASIIIVIFEYFYFHNVIDEYSFKEAKTYNDFLEISERILKNSSSNRCEAAINFISILIDLVNEKKVHIKGTREHCVIDSSIYNNEFRNLIAWYTKTLCRTEGGFDNFEDCYLSINWGGFDFKYSTGEHFFLSLIGRLNYYRKLNQGKNILIVLDESEINFHPEWQKKFLNQFLLNVSRIFNSNGTSMQILLSSHSPISLSDLPKENVIFLKKDPQTGHCQVADGLNDMKQTFGANIHTLLSDSFFMDGLMGDFAKGKIDEVIRYLNGDKVEGMTDEKAEKIIYMIGEPILKRHLMQQMKSRKQNIEIENLKKQIEELKKQNNPEA